MQIIGKNGSVHITTGVLVSKFEKSALGENRTSMIKKLKGILLTEIGRVDSVITAVENQVHDAFPIAMDNVVLPRVEMAVRLLGHQDAGKTVWFMILTRELSRATWKIPRS